MGADDWVVTTYNDFDKRISRFTLENRTEREATKEAEASAEVRQAYNWTLTPAKERAAMSEREKELLRMAVIYAIANRDDVVEAFETDESEAANSLLSLIYVRPNLAVRELSVDGCVIDAPTEEEMSSLLKHF